LVSTQLVTTKIKLANGNADADFDPSKKMPKNTSTTRERVSTVHPTHSLARGARIRFSKIRYGDARRECKLV
jgi:hypothetical protein